MKTILVLGAGRSSGALISYLLEKAAVHNWQIIVGDLSQEAAAEQVNRHERGAAIAFDIQKKESVQILSTADVVISLLPAALHPVVARHCLTFNKHLLTASYVSDEMKAFHAEASQKGLLFLNECGLDPGIDHMSAVQVLDKIRDKGGKLRTFESFTGGLIAPETDPDNPWRYKFTWNPRNVVLAGQGTAKFLQDGEYRYIPYQQLFSRTTAVHVPDYGAYEGYPNRDSLKYIETYGLHDIQTMVRGTLRNSGYCAAWNVLVQLGCCDDTYPMEDVSNMTHRSFINSFLHQDATQSVGKKVSTLFSLHEDGPELTRLRWSGFFDDEKVGLTTGTPAQITEHILQKKWQLQPQDKDMIVMWHRFVYEQNGSTHEVQASLVAQGDDARRTAMAKTVGLPLAIAARLLLTEKITQRGVVIPIQPEFYNPILEELSTLGITLVEREM